ncbi:MAG: DNA (cytosine-5-)-methyltransferase [Nitrospirota bacterium]|nr:DNA (cytosine-5-)-methyltransferase [Nitrospirota bacterium]
MSKDILIRSVPDTVHKWIEDERDRLRMTQQEFVHQVLESASTYGQPSLFDRFAPASQPSPGRIPFTFIDLFAGIGGFRLGLQRAGGRCVFTSEWDHYAQKTYQTWFGDLPHGDIRELNPSDIPDHDVMAAGFPCQPFSIAGVSKKNSLGKAHGFKDATQGTLFFHLATIIEAKRPPVLFLENVKNLLSHDGKKTWAVIDSTLKDLGYHVFPQVIDASAYVPQHRERIIIVCFDRKVFGDRVDFKFPEKPSVKYRLRDILEENPDPKYTLSNHLWSYLQQYAQKHKEKGNGFGFGLCDLDGITRTLSARYYKDGSEILIPQGKGKNPRRLTPREAARLMGFPDELKIAVSDTQAYKQFGNAVVPTVVEAVGRQIVEVLYWHVNMNGLLKGKNRKKNSKQSYAEAAR